MPPETITPSASSITRRWRTPALLRSAVASARGLSEGWRRDRAVRDLWLALAAGWTALAIDGAGPLWWALVLLASTLALGLEYLNTAVEAVLDRFHPQQDSAVGQAKDLAGAAALAGDVGAGGTILLALLLG